MADISIESDLVNLDSSITIVEIANPYLLTDPTKKTDELSNQTPDIDLQPNESNLKPDLAIDIMAIDSDEEQDGNQSDAKVIQTPLNHSEVVQTQDIIQPQKTQSDQNQTVDLTQDSQSPVLLKDSSLSNPYQKQSILSAIAKQTKSLFYSNYNSVGAGHFKIIKDYQTGYQDKFEISEATIDGDHHKYRVVGLDSKFEKRIEVSRRFRHFDSLRQCFIYKFPGLYTPPLPSKQILNNFSQETTLLRVYMLNRFIKQIIVTPYLFESVEFAVFMNPSLQQIEVERQLAVIMQRFSQQAEQHIKMIEPYYFMTGTFSQIELDAAKSEILQFQISVKKMEVFLNKFLDIAIENEKKFDISKEKVKTFNRLLFEYEKHSVECYKPSINLYLGSSSHNQTWEQTENLLFLSPNNETMRQQFDQLMVSLTNPFTQLRHWVKYELYELVAILEAFEQRSLIEKKLRERVDDHLENTSELRKLEKGEMTLKTILKSKESVEKYIQELKALIPVQEATISNSELHLNLIQLQNAKCAVPFFKKAKIDQYYKQLLGYTSREIANCNNLMNLFEQVVGVNSDIIKQNDKMLGSDNGTIIVAIEDLRASQEIKLKLEIQKQVK